MSFDRAVILVQGWFQQQDGGDAAGHLLHPADLVFGHRAGQQLFLAVGEPFLDDLLAADGVLPNTERNVLPVGVYREPVRFSIRDDFLLAVHSLTTFKPRYPITDRPSTFNA